LLTEAEVGAYLEARFPGVVFPAEIIQFLHQRTDGNPLFVASVVDYWQGQGLPVDTERPRQLLEWFRALTAEVPDTQCKLIEQQLGQLGRDDQHLLEAASGAGKEFTAAVVTAGSDDAMEHLESRLETLARREHFVRASGVAM
jgi:predicted ATPase